MNLVDRARNIIVSPKTEWDVVAGEEPNIQQIIVGYVIPLALIPAIAVILGWGLFGVLGYKSFTYGIALGLVQLLNAIIGVFLAAFVIDALATSFGSQKNLGRAVQLVAFSMTPAWLGGILSIFPAIGWLGTLFGLYGLYILYLGVTPLMKTPQDKSVGYVIVSIIVVIIVYFVLAAILTTIMFAIFGLSALYGARF
jgi:hypothetical protein